MSSSDSGASTAKKAKSKRAPASHPKYMDMVVGAIRGLKETKGSSKHAIVKYIMAQYKVGDNDKYINTRVKMSLKSGAASGVLKQVRGIGASGSFRVSDKEPKKKAASPKKRSASPKKPSSPVKKKKKAPAAKKAAASPKKKKATTKKPTPKKTPVKKITKKASPAKKAARSPAKKASASKRKAKK